MQEYLEYILTRLPEIVASVIVFVILYYALDLSAKLYFSIIAAFLTFSILTFLREPVRFNISPSSKEKYPYLLYFSVYVLCAIAIITMPSVNGLEFINWLNVPIINLVRLAASIVLTTFFPGLMILKTIRHNGGKLEKFVFSIIISLFLTSIIQFFIVLSGAAKFTILVLVITNFLLLILCFASSFRKQELKELTLETIHMENSEVFVIIMLVVLQLAFTYCMLSYDFPLPMGDDSYLHGFAIYVSKGAIPTSVPNPFLLMTYLSANFTLSGFPSINTFQVLHFLNILPILAFYLSLKALLGKKYPKVPILGALVGFFSGFTWIYAIGLRTSGYGNLYDLLWGANSKVPGFPLAFYEAPYLTAAQMIGVTSVLLLIYLVFSNETPSSISRLFMISILIAYAYVGHIFDVVVFLVLFFLAILIFDKKRMSTYRRMSVSILLGLFIVLILNSFDPVHRYSGLFLIMSFAIVTLAILFSFLREKVKVACVAIALSKLLKSRCAKIIACFSLIYVYGLSIIIYLQVFPSFNIWDTFFNTKWGNLGQIIPWYSYPIILGTAGLLSLGGVVYLISHKSENKQDFYPFILLAGAFLLLAVALRFYTITLESRLLTYFWVPICVFAAYFISKLSQRFYGARRSLTKKALFSLFLAIILITGLLTTFEYAEVLSTMNNQNAPISHDELEALTYINSHISLNDTVMTLTTNSSNALLWFGGTLNVVSGDYSQTLFEIVEPQVAINQLINLRVKYIFMAFDDFELANSTPSIRDGYIYSQLLKSAPAVYNNSNATVYMVNPFDTIEALSSESGALGPPLSTIVTFSNQSTSLYNLTCYNSRILSYSPLTIQSGTAQYKEIEIYFKTGVNLADYRYALIEWESPNATLFFYPRGLRSGFVNMMLGTSSEMTTTLIDLYSAPDFVAAKSISLRGDNLTEMIFRVFVNDTTFSIGKVSFIKDISGDNFAPKEVIPSEVTLPNVIYGQANMSGTMTIDTDSVVALMSDDGILTPLSVSNFSYEHVYELESNSPTKLVFNADECLIKPFSGEYVYLELKGYANILIYTSNLSVSSTNFGTYNFTGNPSIEVNGSDVTIFVRAPVINVQGSVYLKKSIIFDEFRSALIDLLPCTVKGNMSFNIDSSEGQIIFFNNLKYEGVLESNQPYSNSPPLREWQIPLIAVLVSPVNVLIIVLAILISLKLNHIRIKMRVKRS